jgi:putative transcriptional regulator
MSIMNKLRDMRFELKMDQNDFAEFMGVTNTLYNKWERQRSQPSLEWALKIAKITNKPVESIFYLNE